MVLDAAGFRRVHGAVCAGHFETLRRELEPFGDWPNTSPDGAIGLPLVYAIYHGPFELIEQLLDGGADPDGSDGDGFPPLIAALSPPDRDDVAQVLTLLLDRGADIELRGMNDYAPLHAATAAGRLDLVELLLDRGADPNAIPGIDDMETALEIAEAAGHDAIADRLGSVTTLPDWIRASSEGDVPTLRRILATGYDVDATDGYGQTALMRAAHRGRLEAVEYLLGQGAALDRSAKFGLSALTLAVIQRHPRVARTLVRAGADTSLRGTGAPGFADKTAADLAEEAGDRRLAEFIRSAGD